MVINRDFFVSLVLPEGFGHQTGFVYEIASRVRRKVFDVDGGVLLLLFCRYSFTAAPPLAQPKTKVTLLRVAFVFILDC